MLEYGVRQAGRRNKVTARFIEIADLAREAHYNAAAAGNPWSVRRTCAALCLRKWSATT